MGPWLYVDRPAIVEHTCNYGAGIFKWDTYSISSLTLLKELGAQWPSLYCLALFGIQEMVFRSGGFDKGEEIRTNFRALDKTRYVGLYRTFSVGNL